ncbi:Integrase, catalytic core [Gossypium australe]|uniref:Integrase, catalytic core n=1 Tax=Gossypium australe TaxID=47621 RepID=A0A5B6WRC2_9ROSI|nr:Integrase, catalytic core [Gossypium australe]
MDFTTGLPLTSRKKDGVWVIVESYTLENYVELYILEVLQLYGVPVFIISYCNSRLTSQFWNKLRKLYYRLKKEIGETSFICRISYNNSYHSSIQMTLYEILYELSERKIVGPYLICGIEKKVKLIRDRLKTALDR